jgi:CRP/FNR family transcriptional regulator, cyclic AMP receptor protein
MKTRADFNPLAFLSTIGDGRVMLSFEKKETIFAQGDSTDGLFFIQKGKVRLSVVSETGKEATLAILGEKDFFGESGLAGQLLRMSSAMAITHCILLHVEKEGDDVGDECGTKTVCHVRQVLAEAKHALSG